MNCIGNGEGQRYFGFYKRSSFVIFKGDFEGLNGSMSYATLKRRLSGLLDKQYIVQQGNAKIADI